VLARQFTDTSGWELQNMLTVARIIIEAALIREETRGVHYRTDFPETDDVHWKRRITFRRDGEAVGRQYSQSTLQSPQPRRPFPSRSFDRARPGQIVLRFLDPKGR